MKVKYHQPDYVFMLTILLIVIFGLVMLSSASTAVAYKRFGDSYHYLKHQILFGLIPGLILLIFTIKIDYHKWKKYALYFLIITFLLLLAVFIPQFSVSYGKAKSWIRVGGIIFQPAEIVKLTFILYLATWLSNREKKITTYSHSFFPFLFILGAVSSLIALQPDIGTMSIIVLTALSLFFVAGARLFHIFLIFILGGGMLVLLIKLAPYRLARLKVFLNPSLEPQGIGYHINQALLAIGSGGLFGRGLGHSVQKFLYLPEVTGDSIFAVIAEEMGFIVVTGLLFLFFLLVIRGIKIARNAPDLFGRYIVLGIIFWFIFQIIINIGGMVGLLPMTGLPLPFISAGGTALAISLAAVGILINVSKQANI